MFDRTKKVKVVNRYSGHVGYSIPELNIVRQFEIRESKDISFDELERLAYTSGGPELLTNYLLITDREVLAELPNLGKIEPEYFYEEKDVIGMLTTASLDAFLDCLDFAPDGVLDLIKEKAVELPLNDVSKRNAIKDKLNFDVEQAIIIKNTKSEAEKEGSSTEAKQETSNGRRTSVPTPTEESGESGGRRVAAPEKYKVVK